MEASFLDLRRNMKDILSALERNESVTIFYRGKKKAELRPFTHKKGKMRVQDHKAFGMWADRSDMSDVDSYVLRLRQRREHGV